MNYNKPSIPKGTRCIFSIRRLYATEYQLFSGSIGFSSYRYFTRLCALLGA